MSDSEKEASEKVSVPNGWKPDEFKPEDNPTTTHTQGKQKLEGEAETKTKRIGAQKNL